MQRRQALNTATGAAVALGSLGLVSNASAGENVSLRGPIMDGDPFTPRAERFVWPSQLQLALL